MRIHLALQSVERTDDDEGFENQKIWPITQPIRTPVPSTKLAAKGFDFTTNLTLDFSVFQVILFLLLFLPIGPISEPPKATTRAKINYRSFYGSPALWYSLKIQDSD